MVEAKGSIALMSQRQLTTANRAGRRKRRISSNLFGIYGKANNRVTFCSLCPIRSPVQVWFQRSASSLWASVACAMFAVRRPRVESQECKGRKRWNLLAFLAFLTGQLLMLPLTSQQAIHVMWFLAAEPQIHIQLVFKKETSIQLDGPIQSFVPIRAGVGDNRRVLIFLLHMRGEAMAALNRWRQKSCWIRSRQFLFILSLWALCFLQRFT